MLQAAFPVRVLSCAGKCTLELNVRVTVQFYPPNLILKLLQPVMKEVVYDKICDHFLVYDPFYYPIGKWVKLTLIFVIFFATAV